METKNYLNELSIAEELGYGASGRVYSCEFMNKRMAFKKLTGDDNYREFILPRLEGISKFYGDSRFILPYKLIYNNPTDNVFTGYTMDCINNYHKLCDFELSYKDKIHILNKARQLLDIFHNDYKHIHTDINPWNFLYNKELDKIVLIDFDTCIDLTREDSMDNYYLNTLSKIYCEYNGFNVGLDIFMFNLLTFSILNNVEFYDVINEIFDNNYGCIENNRAIEILRDYEDIESNTLKREYIIDHL